MLRQLMQMQFYIPYYQRNYTWEKQHALALLDDFKDAVQRIKATPVASSNHYLANFVLMNRKDNKNHKDIIDGQQRLTTIVMILKAIAEKIHNLTKSSSPVPVNATNAINDIDGILWPNSNGGTFIFMSPSTANSNIHFLDELLKGHAVNAQTAIQKNINNVFSFLKQNIHNNLNYLIDLYNCILDSETTEHYVNDILEANRIFITLNARGKPLTFFEKTKGLLIYYAEKIGSLTLASDIDKDFGKIFEFHERIQIISHSQIPFIKLRLDGSFDLDVFLGWHYCIFEKQQQIISADMAYSKLDSKLKSTANPIDWQNIIDSYRKSAVEFANQIHNVFSQLQTSTQYFEAIAMCRFTSIVWPLITACGHRGFLGNQINLPKGNTKDMFRLIQVTDKIHRGTRVQGQDLIALAYDTFNDPNLTAQDIGDRIIGYNNNKWAKNGYTMSGVFNTIGEEGSDYKNYLLFDSVTLQPNRATVPALMQIRSKNYQAARVLRNYVGVRVRADHNYNTANDFVTGIASIGNHILLSKSDIETVSDLESISGPLDPCALKIAVIHSTSLHAETLRVLNGIHGNTSIDKISIDNRAKIIATYLDANWEI